MFVILTHCQFEKNGYQNRFKMGDDWYTMRVNKGLIPISEKKYVEPYADWDKICRKLPQYRGVLLSFPGYITPSLAQTNINIIRHIARMLGINTRIELDYETELTGTERLVDICQKYKATTYLSGMSGAHYMDKSLWDVAGIDVDFQGEDSMIKRPILEMLQTKLGINN